MVAAGCTVLVRFGFTPPLPVHTRGYAVRARTRTGSAIHSLLPVGYYAVACLVVTCRFRLGHTFLLLDYLYATHARFTLPRLPHRRLHYTRLRCPHCCTWLLPLRFLPRSPHPARSTVLVAFHGSAQFGYRLRGCRGCYRTVYVPRICGYILPVAVRLPFRLLPTRYRCYALPRSLRSRSYVLRVYWLLSSITLRVGCYRLFVCRSTTRSAAHCGCTVYWFMRSRILGLHVCYRGYHFTVVTHHAFCVYVRLRLTLRLPFAVLRFCGSFFGLRFWFAVWFTVPFSVRTFTFVYSRLVGYYTVYVATHTVRYRTFTFLLRLPSGSICHVGLHALLWLRLYTFTRLLRFGCCYLILRLRSRVTYRTVTLRLLLHCRFSTTGCRGYILLHVLRLFIPCLPVTCTAYGCWLRTHAVTYIAVTRTRALPHTTVPCTRIAAYAFPVVLLHTVLHTPSPTVYVLNAVDSRLRTVTVTRYLRLFCCTVLPVTVVGLPTRPLTRLPTLPYRFYHRGWFWLRFTAYRVLRCRSARLLHTRLPAVYAVPVVDACAYAFVATRAVPVAAGYRTFTTHVAHICRASLLVTRTRTGSHVWLVVTAPHCTAPGSFCLTGWVWLVARLDIFDLPHAY